MYKHLLLILSVCFWGSASFGATITGTVRDANTGAVIASQEVCIQDSLYSFWFFVTTNSSGIYTATVPTSTAVGTGMLVYANACNHSEEGRYTFDGSNKTIDFNLCPAPYKYFLAGRFNSAALYASRGPATVYLIRKSYDPVLMDTTLTAIDSMAAAYYINFDFAKYYDTIPSGTLLLKAALDVAHPDYANYPPAYHDSSLRWNGATPLTNRSFISDTTDILMRRGVNPGGPAFISGSVLQGANKSSGIGDPLGDRILILTNLSGQPVAFTRSNASGQFSIGNLAYGVYLLFGDAPGKANPDLVVTLSPSQDSVTDIIFEENNKQFKGRSFTLSVASKILDKITVTPNPVSNVICINGLETIHGNKTIVVRDEAGTVVSLAKVKQGQIARIEAEQLAQGVYFLQIVTDEGIAGFKLVK